MNVEPSVEPSTDQEPTEQKPTDQESTEQKPTDQESTEQSLKAYLSDEYDYHALRRGDICTGVVVETNDRGLIVDVGFKREGFVSAEDLKRLDEETRSGIHVGAAVPVFVLQPEDREGHPILSIHQARLYEDWLRADKLLESGELYEGEVSGYNRGGLVVRFGRIRGFIPASQVVGLPRKLREEERRRRLADMVGQTIGLKVIEVDRYRRRLIFSQRRALRAWQELQRERVMAELTEGETRRGKVTDLTNFGAFVDLGGADGLIHVSELSWRRVKNPREVLRVGEEVEVYVLNVDRARKRIALSLKKLQPDPWTLVDDYYEVGQLVEGRVTRVLDFGAFVELDLGVEGLLHVSEMIGAPEVQPSEIVHSGETLLVKVIRIDSRRRRIALSARRVGRDEWERWVAERQAAHEAEERAVAEEAEEETAAGKAEEAAAAVAEAEREEAPVEEVAAAIEETEEEAAASEEEQVTAEVDAADASEEEAVSAVADEAAPAAESPTVLEGEAVELTPVTSSHVASDDVLG